MDWKVVDERLIRYGELLLSLDFVDGYDDELEAMNRGKVGFPYKLTDHYVEFLAVVRYLFLMPYMQLEGFTRAIRRLVPKLPLANYSGLRRRILRLDLSPYMPLQKEGGPILIAVNSTSIKIHQSDGWIERVHKKKRHIKIHSTVNMKLRR